MEDRLNPKEAIKQHTILLIIYAICDMIIFMFMRSEIRVEDFKGEMKKLLVIIFVLTFFVIVLNLLKVNYKNIISCVIGVECIFFSVVMLIMVSEKTYELNPKMWISVPLSYIIMIFILFCLNRYFYQKLPNEGEQSKKGRSKAGGIAVIAASGGIGIGNWARTYNNCIPYILISILIIYGWLALGWFFFQARKRYIKKK